MKRAAASLRARRRWARAIDGMLDRAATPDPDWLPWSLRSVYSPGVVTASAEPLIEIRGVLTDPQRLVSAALLARLNTLLCDGYASPLLHADAAASQRACGELAAAFRFAPVAGSPAQDEAVAVSPTPRSHR